MKAADMNMKRIGPYVYMTKIRLLLSMTYRSDFFISLIAQVMLLFVSAFFWRAAYSGGAGSVASVNERQMLVYSVMAIVLSNLFTVTVENNVRGKVRKGDIAVDYIKPVDVFLIYFSEDLGNMITSLAQRVAPVLLCSALFIVAPLPKSAFHFVLFLCSAILSFLLLWIISALFGLLYFKVIDMGPLGSVKDYLIKILAGTFVPIWFFPSVVQKVLNFLPFIYTYQLPLSIYIGRSSIPEALRGMGVQAFWVLLFGTLFFFCKGRVEKNLFVQGG